MSRIELEGLNNTRDLGGIRTMDGRCIKKGRLLRSGRLQAASRADEEWIRSHVSMVIDFRSHQEMVEQPDPVIPGVAMRHIPIIDSLAAGVTRDAASDEDAFLMLTVDLEGARRYMCRTYEGFITSKSALQGYEAFVRLLCENREKALLWHCTAGKDRAGLAAVIVLEILGVDREVIKADYLETNICIEQSISELISIFAKHSEVNRPMDEEALRYMFEAREEFLDAAYRKAEECYGSFQSFLRNGLHVEEKEIETIRELYL